MLYFLHQLTNSAVSDGRTVPSWQKLNRLHPQPPPANGAGRTGGEGSLPEAFSENGLRRLPTREGGQRERPGLDADARPPSSGSKSGLGSGLGKALRKTESFDAAAPSEASLLRDLPFALQGLSSAHFPFTSSGALSFPKNLSPSTLSILHALAEPSLLYRGLSKYIQEPAGGLIRQSLRAAVGSELRSYLGLVATLEGEIRRALASMETQEPGSGVGKSGVTLRRCIIWTKEATKGLRLMSVIVEESKSAFPARFPNMAGYSQLTLI